MDGQRNAVPIYYFGQVNHYIGLMKFDDGVLSAFFSWEEPGAAGLSY